MDLPFIAATLTRRGLLAPGGPIRVVSQLNALRRWGWSLAGELRQAAARDPGRVAVVDEQGAPRRTRNCSTAPSGWPGRCAPTSACRPATGWACSAATTTA